MSNNIGPKIGVDGEKEFKQQIADCNNSLKTMGTEMAKVTSAFIGNENSSKALRATNKQLTAQFDELSNKADIQRARLAELDKAGVDPTSAAYQKLVQDLNKTEAEMNKTSAQIDQNNEKLKHHGKTAEEAHKKHAEAAKKAAAAVAAVTAAVAAVGAGLVKMTLDAAEAADELNTLSDKTGLSTDELQKLQYAAGTVDVSVETVAGAMGKMSKQMASAADGSKSAQAAFEKLGVSVQNDDGTFRDRNQVFKESIKALGKITDETERDAAAMAIFGKSATELNPLIKGGADALEELGAHAEETGLIMSGEALDSLAGLADRFDVLKQTVGLAGQQFLAQFAGPLTEGINTLIGYVERLVGAFQNGGLAELGNEVGKVATDMASAFTSALPQIASFASSVIITLGDGLISMLPSVVESALTIVSSLASSISSALPELIPVAVDAILAIVDTLTNPDSIGQLVDAAIAITMGLADGLISALPRLLQQAPVIVSSLVTALVQNAPKLLVAAFQAIETLVSGLLDNLVLIGQAAGEIVGTLLKGLADLGVGFLDAGRNIVEGIWEGIKGAGDWLWQQIKGFFGGLIDGICEFLGIHSPSTVFADRIGKNMALGIGEGFDDTMAGVERDMMSSIPVPTVNASVGATGADGGFGGFGSEKVVIGFDVDADGLVRFLRPYIKDEDLRVGGAMVI